MALLCCSSPLRIAPAASALQKRRPMAPSRLLLSRLFAQERESPTAPEPEGVGDGGAWKWPIRKRIWDLLEREDVAAYPRPVHHRIPNFVGASLAASQIQMMKVQNFYESVVLVTGNKKLLVPQPRLITGFFTELDTSFLARSIIPEACTTAGAAKYGKPIGTDAKLKVDMLVIGSVAVDPTTGARLGKGEGFAELEYGLLRYMGAIDDSTLVVTTIHDKQLVHDISASKLRVHDVPVDVICTPTQVIYTDTKIPKPQGIYWDLLSPQKLAQIQVLQDLKKKIELETGEKLPTGPSEELPPLAKRNQAWSKDGKS